VFRLDDEAENNEANRRQVCIDFVRYLNEDVQWRFPQSFRFVSDETVVVNRKPSSKKEEIPKATEVKKTVKKNVFEDFDDNGEEEDPIVKKKDSEIKRGTKADPKGKMNFLFED